MANCPVCSDVLLRHIRSGQTYWFCRRCRVEIAENSKPDHIAALVAPVEELTSTAPSIAFAEELLQQTLPKNRPHNINR